MRAFFKFFLFIGILFTMAELALGQTPPTPGGGTAQEKGFLLKVSYGRGLQGTPASSWITVPETMEVPPASNPAQDQIYGAIVVVNKNDTDSDGVLDYEEGGHRLPSSPAKEKEIKSLNGAVNDTVKNGDGRLDEVDLIKVELTIPAQTLGKLKSSDPYRISFWRDINKKEVAQGLQNNGTRCSQYTVNNNTNASIQKTVYVEVHPKANSDGISTALNSDWITYEGTSNPGTPQETSIYDKVAVTAIWAKTVGAQVSRQSFSEISRINNSKIKVRGHQNYDLGDQICIYDDNETAGSGVSFYVADVVGVASLSNNWFELELEQRVGVNNVKANVPTWVGTGDSFAKGISALDDSANNRANMENPVYSGVIGHDRGRPVAYWGIEVAFQAFPSGITRAKLSGNNNPRIKFDVTRQVYRNSSEAADQWRSRSGTLYQPVSELPNDDPTELDEDCDTMAIPPYHTSSSYVSHDFLYQIDAPGADNTQDFIATDTYWLMGNFVEFTRVSFDGTAPKGNVLSGGRCSEGLKWNTRSNLIASSTSSGTDLQGNTLYYAQKNPNAPQVDVLDTGQSGEIGNRTSTPEPHNQIQKFKWMRFDKINIGN